MPAEFHPLPPFDPEIHRIGGVCLRHPEGEGRRYLRNGQCVLCHRDARAANKRARQASRGIKPKRHVVGITYDEGVLLLKALVDYNARIPTEGGALMVRRFKTWLADIESRTETGGL